MADRVRIPPTLEQQIHRFALRENRSFENAARQLLTIGLTAASTRSGAQPREAVA